ncbi:hypothetical protein [Paenibacillus alvei]|uniref:hypothetical protein n=1 Tax=Paenibacillus alvei TaxID=44250 RepID=UPI0013D92A9E|nr:hypothetical protein [Paenibacillus alvei]NEZ45365.1 hypothetical protein [Paenibacillus alvei]
MDRFERGLPDPQEAKVVDECLECGAEIYQGQTAVKAGDGHCCNFKCFALALGAILITVGEEDK